MTGDPPSTSQNDPFAADHCRYFEGLFSPYIHGNLDAETRRALAEHLHECEFCAERFGLAWRAEATQAAGGQLSPVGKRLRGTMPRGRRRFLWVVIGASLIGMLVFAGRGGGFGNSRGFELANPDKLFEEEIGRTIQVQNRLLEVLARPLESADLKPSHAARGEARDWFQAWSKARREGLSSVLPLIHSYVRLFDCRPGGEQLGSRQLVGDAEKPGRWSQGKVPDLVLMQLRDATRDAMFCEAICDRQPAYVFLVRERPMGQKQAPADHVGSWPPLRLAMVLLTEP
ncbi:MAG: hypothetical protein CSA62_08045 [Planctomycetota bacterium]|nr:MAG: hypothetical protein CSA62_08045 [Planctomycetota bacterium]